MEKEKILNRVLVLAPGLFVAAIFFFLRDHTTALILVTMDVTGAVLQTWWIANSGKIAHRIWQSWLLRKTGMSFVYKYHSRNPITLDVIRNKLGLVSRYGETRKEL